jgi:imidazolonepropionase-like amidohydrolase
MRRITLALSFIAGLAIVSLGAQASYIYAIQGARIVPVSGATIENGTVVIRDGLIAAVGASVTVPPGAQIIPGKGLTVYPGLIDMGSATGIDMPAVPRAENPQTTEDVERVKASYLLRAQFRAADYVNPTTAALARVAAAGITSVLATPSGDAIRGQSALINTALPPDEPQIGAVADERKGAMIVRTPVALHITFSERPAGGNAYPNSLMGVIAYVRQAFIDAQHYQLSRKYAEATTNGGSRPTTVRSHYEPALEAMLPALAGRLPVAFRGQSAREILRALDMAKSFKLDPIITDGREADQVATDLKAAGARVIVSLNFPTRPLTLAPDADEPLRTLRERANAPKVAAALHAAGVIFAFESAGLTDPKDFIKNAAKAVQNGLAREDAIRALTLNAATIAGAADRLGSLEAGKMANVLVTEGDLFNEKMTIKHVFVEGRPVNLELPPDRSNRRPGSDGGN